MYGMGLINYMKREPGRYICPQLQSLPSPSSISTVRPAPHVGSLAQHVPRPIDTPHNPTPAQAPCKFGDKSHHVKGEVRPCPLTEGRHGGSEGQDKGKSLSHDCFEPADKKARAGHETRELGHADRLPVRDGSASTRNARASSPCTFSVHASAGMSGKDVE